jgi:type IV pilus assembly protein PilW
LSPAMRRRRGFTLIELIVGLAVAAVVLAAIAAAIIAMNGVFQANGVTKTTVESGRASLAYLERTLPKAGYGIPPEFAFDFNLIAGVAQKDNELGPAGAFVTDDLAYRYRDPTYMRFGAIDSTFGTITLEGADTFGINIKQGQTLMVSCIGSAQKYIMVRTTAAVVPADTTAQVAAYGAPFPVANDACMQGTGSSAAFVMLVHEMRVRVIPLAPGNRPFLVVNHNLQNLNDFDVLAPDVENFQVAYIMNQPSPALAPAPPVVDATATNPNWIIGDEVGAPPPDLPNPAAVKPLYTDSYSIPARFNAHPANIRGVRVMVTLRSKAPMPNQAVGTFPKETIGNFTWTGPADGFYRLTLSSQAMAPNMASRGLMTPSYADSADPTDRRNKWGG